MAAALERGSAHPLAEAFRPHQNANLRADALSEFEGAGVEGRIDGVRWRLGRRELRRRAGSACPGVAAGAA